jgi:DNA-binding SARP family transcriptional activator
VPGRLEFRILGPLEVRYDGEALPLAGAKQRALVAVLALRTGEVVSADALIDALWGEDPPTTARTALQVQVSKLRKLLAGRAGGAATLETREPGYVLRVDPDAVDLARFDALLEDGRDALARGEPERARESLGRALELWRGSPLDGLDVPGMPPGALTDLEERRTAAIEARLEADLALGRHADAVSELDRLLAEHPMNERLHQLAALTLYRAGRQGDALEVCARLRRTLSEELGIEPSPAVLDLEQRILRHDASLDLPREEIPQPDERAHEGRKTIAALVCRVALGRTDGRSLDPEAERHAMRRFVDAARAAVEGHGGTVRDAQGSALVALFGVPRVHEDDAVRAMRAAVEIRDLAADIDDHVRREVRIGIETGEVLVEDASGVQTVLSGEPLAAADRVARAAGPGEVLISQTVFRLAHPSADAEALEVPSSDDGALPAAAFRLLSVAQGVPGEVRRLRAPLVGRTEELGVLRQAFGRASRDRSCSMVSVLGPAGVGKTKLVTGFVQDLGNEATVLEGRCLPYGRDITFWPIAEVVKAAAGIADGDAPSDAVSRIEDVVRGIDEPAFIASQVAGVLGLVDVPLSPEEIFWAIRKFLEAAARERPLVVWLDDLHWADATLLDLIEHVAMWSRDAPILLVCSARPELVEDRAGWGGGRLDATNLTLGPLSREETADLLDHLLGRAELAGASRERIMDAAEGNPLFLEELLSMLIDEGRLVWRDDRWTPSGDLTDVPIPLTVQALLAARIDRLPPHERRSLEHAAVIGKEFSEEDLAELGEGEGLGQVLDGLAGKDLLVPERLGPRTGRTFRFRHILLRDVVYQGMSKEARARDHEVFGASLERRAAERLTEVEEIVGYHLEAANSYLVELGLPDPGEPSLAVRAGERLAAAGRRAVDRGDMPAAVSLLRRADALLPADAPMRSELARMLTIALMEVGELAGALTAVAEGLEVAERLGDEAAVWRLRVEREEVWAYLDPDAHPARAREELATEAVEAFERLEDLAGRARAYRLLGDALSHRGQMEDAARAFLIGQDLATQAGDDREVAERPGLGVTMGAMPVEHALEVVRRHAELPRPNPDSLSSLGVLYAMQGDMDASRLWLEAALARARELGSEMRTASISMYYGYALLIADDPSGAEAVVRPAVESLQAMGERNLLSTAAALLAEVLYRQGKLDEAMLASLMSEEATASDDVASQMMWRGGRAKLLQARGHAREAEALARAGVAFADQTDMPTLEGDAYRDLGTVLQAGGRSAEAAEAYGEAERRYLRKGNAVSAERVREAREALGS